MIVDARDGNTSRGFKTYTNKGALAHFLDLIPVGGCVVLTGFIRVDGAPEETFRVQMLIGSAKAKGSVYRTKTSKDGTILVRRIS